MKPTRFPARARQAAKYAIKRADTTETWAVFKELYRTAQKSRKRDAYGYMREIWEIKTTRDVMDLIKEVSEDC